MHHEFRLHWRGLNRKFSSNTVLILLLVLLHLVAVPVAFAVKRMPPLPPAASAALLTLGGCFILLLMTSRGLVMTVQAFFARGDMDLILSSPLPPQSLLTVRTATIAASLTMEFALLIWPFTNVFVLFGIFGALKGYVLLPALGLLATSISLMLALLLVRAFGARRTRVISQVLSALIAISFTLIFQIPNMTARSARRPTYDAQAYTRYAPVADSWFWTPALAVMHGFLTTFALAAVCALVFWLTTRQLSGSFIRASIASAGIAGGTRARVPMRDLRFIDDLRLIVIRKELRLIARDPWLLTQLLQQSFVVLPLAVVLWRQHGRGLPLVWGTLIFVTANIASALAWLTVTAEDAPELLAASPIESRYFVRAKLAAALLPIVPLALLPLLLLASSHIWFGFSVSLCAIGSALSCALLNIYDRAPAQRREFRQRLRGNAARSFLELGTIVAWLGVCALMVWLGP